MIETCAVCRKGKGPEKCEVCGFSDNGFINRNFPIPEDAVNWLDTVVKPYRVQWEARKREAELLRNLIIKIKELENRVEELEKNIPTNGKYQESKEVFYLSGPTQNKFNAIRVSKEIIDGESIYRFERKLGEDRALVYVENSLFAVDRFTNNPEAQDGVCDEVGGNFSNATAIKTVEPGTAYLKDGYWYVDKKVKIKYS